MGPYLAVPTSPRPVYCDTEYYPTVLPGVFSRSAMGPLLWHITVCAAHRHSCVRYHPRELTHLSCEPCDQDDGRLVPSADDSERPAGLGASLEQDGQEGLGNRTKNNYQIYV